MLKVQLKIKVYMKFDQKGNIFLRPSLTFWGQQNLVEIRYFFNENFYASLRRFEATLFHGETGKFKTKFFSFHFIRGPPYLVSHSKAELPHKRTSTHIFRLKLLLYKKQLGNELIYVKFPIKKILYIFYIEWPLPPINAPKTWRIITELSKLIVVGHFRTKILSDFEWFVWNSGFAQNSTPSFMLPRGVEPFPGNFYHHISVKVEVKLIKALDDIWGCAYWSESPQYLWKILLWVSQWSSIVEWFVLNEHRVDLFLSRKFLVSLYQWVFLFYFEV